MREREEKKKGGEISKAAVACESLTSRRLRRSRRSRRQRLLLPKEGGLSKAAAFFTRSDQQEGRATSLFFSRRLLITGAKSFGLETLVGLDRPTEARIRARRPTRAGPREASIAVGLPLSACRLVGRQGGELRAKEKKSKDKCRKTRVENPVFPISGRLFLLKSRESGPNSHRIRAVEMWRVDSDKKKEEKLEVEKKNRPY